MTNITIKPFLKWVGGKGRLLPEISKYYPFGTKITKYVEPFIGGGAVLFDVLNNYSLKEVYINDLNKELINSYLCIRDDCLGLIDLLDFYQKEYLMAADRKEYYLTLRDLYNKKEQTKTEQAALFIFLNKTCFNGLYRVNKKNEFNVPAGTYINPKIYDKENLLNISEKIKDINILNVDYRDTLNFADEHTFFYLDPPYRPISKTSNFTGYTSQNFTEESQKELSEYVLNLHKKGSLFLLSNSDPSNCNEQDSFFKKYYCHFSMIQVKASRTINANTESRGKISELLIHNIKLNNRYRSNF